MLYTAWYKNPRGFIWHKVKNVEGDTTMESEKGRPMPVRVLFLSNKIRLEVPMTCLIKFSKERFYDIEKSMSKESGQRISGSKKR